MKKKTTIALQMKGKSMVQRKKAHLTGEFVIVTKFGGHALCHLASRLANMIRQGGIRLVSRSQTLFLRTALIDWEL